MSINNATNPWPGAYQQFPITGAAQGVPPGSYTIANVPYSGSDSWTTVGINTRITPKSISVEADAEFKGKVIIQGKDLCATLDKIEERLGILHPNPELESRWKELQELSNRYRELERELLEKEQVWDILKR